jgi:HEAT repeat protein
MIQALEKVMIIIDQTEPYFDSGNSRFKLSNYFREEVAEHLGKLDNKNPFLFKAFCKIINTAKFDSELSWAVSKLKTIDISNPQLIDVLIQLAESRSDRELYLEIIKALGLVGYGSIKATSFLEKALKITEENDVIREVAESLGKISLNKTLAIRTLVKLLNSNYEDFFPRKVAESLVAVGRTQESIDALIHLLDTNDDERTLREAAEVLGKLDPGNPKVSITLINLLAKTSSDVIILRVAESFIKLDIHKPIAVKALEFLIKNSHDKVVPIHAADLLGKYSTDSYEAIEMLVKEVRECCSSFCIAALEDISVNHLREIPVQALEFILSSSENDFKEVLTKENTSTIALEKIWAARSLGKIDPYNSKAVKRLLSFIKSAQNDTIIESAGKSLIKILETRSFQQVVLELKPFINSNIYENDSKRFKNCFKVVWHCAKNMSYPDFFITWNT